MSGKPPDVGHPFVISGVQKKIRSASADRGHPPTVAEVGFCEKMLARGKSTFDMELDDRKIEDAVLALLYLTFMPKDRRAWKSLDSEAMNRLHQRALISDPVSKAKSVMMTEEGEAEGKRLAGQLFGKS